jgi:hypothetical protein
MTARARSRSPSPPDDTAAAAGVQQQQQQPDRVQQQLDALGDCHIGYNHMQLPNSNVSVVGARPFSKVRCFNSALPAHFNSSSSQPSEAQIHRTTLTAALLSICLSRLAHMRARPRSSVDEHNHTHKKRQVSAHHLDLHAVHVGY